MSCDSRAEPDHPIALDGLAHEGVAALREALLELLQRDLVEGRLVALGEELGQAQFFSRPSAAMSRSVRPLGRGDRNRPPGLAVQEELDACAPTVESTSTIIVASSRRTGFAVAPLP